MLEKFFKNEISVTLIYFKFKSTSWKNRSTWFRWWIWQSSW